MFIDDIFAVSCNVEAILEVVQKTFKLKNDKIEAPEFYLGAKLSEKTISGVQCWTITRQEYIKVAVKNLEESLKNSRRQMPTSHIDTLMNNTHVPELDVTEELEDKDVTYFQELIGILRWATEIGRVDILLEVLLLLQYQASPRERHLEQLLHIFAFLKKHPKLTFVSIPGVAMNGFRRVQDLQRLLRRDLSTCCHTECLRKKDEN